MISDCDIKCDRCLKRCCICFQIAYFSFYLFELIICLLFRVFLLYINCQPPSRHFDDLVRIVLIWLRIDFRNGCAEPKFLFWLSTTFASSNVTWDSTIHHTNIHRIGSDSIISSLVTSYCKRNQERPITPFRTHCSLSEAFVCIFPRDLFSQI